MEETKCIWTKADVRDYLETIGVIAGEKKLRKIIGLAKSKYHGSTILGVKYVKRKAVMELLEGEIQ